MQRMTFARVPAVPFSSSAVEDVAEQSPVTESSQEQGFFRPPNLKLDAATHKLVQKQQKLEEAAALYRDLSAPVKTVDVISLSSGEPTGKEIVLDNRVFSGPIRPDIVHRVIVWQEKNARKTLYKTKGVSEVRGGGRKPWRQKGSGRARHGSIRSPLWVGGAVAHGPVLRDWSIRLQKKVRRLGMRSALAAKYKDCRLVVVDDLVTENGVAKEGMEVLKALGLENKRVLFVGGEAVDKNFIVSMRNIQRVKVLPQVGANVRDIVLADTLVVTQDALDLITQRVTKED